jgi:hypothetical protein
MKTKKMLAWSDVLERDMPEQAKITNEIRRQTAQQSDRFRGSVRLSIGHFWTDDEYQQFRNEVLNTPLP